LQSISSSPDLYLYLSVVFLILFSPSSDYCPPLLRPTPPPTFFALLLPFLFPRQFFLPNTSSSALTNALRDLRLSSAGSPRFPSFFQALLRFLHLPYPDLALSMFRLFCFFFLRVFRFFVNNVVPLCHLQAVFISSTSMFPESPPPLLNFYRFHLSLFLNPSRSPLRVPSPCTRR